LKSFSQIKSLNQTKQNLMMEVKKQFNGYFMKLTKEIIDQILRKEFGTVEVPFI